MFQPIRVAVCGRKNAPPLFETMIVLGRDICLARIRPSRNSKSRISVQLKRQDCSLVTAAYTLTPCNRSITLRSCFPSGRSPNSPSWLDGLKDNRVRGAVAGRIKRLTFGLLGDFKAIGGGVIELRIDFGAGWRLYYTQRGTADLVLLAGGSKRTRRRYPDELRLWPHC